MRLAFVAVLGFLLGFLTTVVACGNPSPMPSDQDLEAEVRARCVSLPPTLTKSSECLYPGQSYFCGVCDGRPLATVCVNDGSGNYIFAEDCRDISLWGKPCDCGGGVKGIYEYTYIPEATNDEDRLLSPPTCRCPADAVPPPPPCVDGTVRPCRDPYRAHCQGAFEVCIEGRWSDCATGCAATESCPGYTTIDHDCEPLDPDKPCTRLDPTCQPECDETYKNGSEKCGECGGSLHCVNYRKVCGIYCPDCKGGDGVQRFVPSAAQECQLAPGCESTVQSGALCPETCLEVVRQGETCDEPYLETSAGLQSCVGKNGSMGAVWVCNVETGRSFSCQPACDAGADCGGGGFRYWTAGPEDECVPRADRCEPVAWHEVSQTCMPECPTPGAYYDGGCELRMPFAGGATCPGGTQICTDWGYWSPCGMACENGCAKGLGAASTNCSANAAGQCGHLVVTQEGCCTPGEKRDAGIHIIYGGEWCRGAQFCETTASGGQWGPVGVECNTGEDGTERDCDEEGVRPYGFTLTCAVSETLACVAPEKCNQCDDNLNGLVDEYVCSPGASDGGTFDGGTSDGGIPACSPTPESIYASGTQGLEWPPACWRPFAPSSPFNTPIPASAKTNQLHPNSANIIAQLVRPFQSGGFGDMGPFFLRRDGHSGEPTYYSGGPDDEVYTIECPVNDPYGAAPGSCPINGLPVSLPRYALPEAAWLLADGGINPNRADSHMTIIDVANGYEWDFWQMHTVPLPPDGGPIQMAFGNRMKLDAGFITYDYRNATAGWVPSLEGRVRAEELIAGEINHALFFNVRCQNDAEDAGTGSTILGAAGVVYPAYNPTISVSSNNPGGYKCSLLGTGLVNDAPAMGAHFFYDLTPEQIDGQGDGGLRYPDGGVLPQWKRAVLKAMSRYGLFVADTGWADPSPTNPSALNPFGWGWVVEGESDSMYTTAGEVGRWWALAEDAGTVGGWEFRVGNDGAFGTADDEAMGFMYVRYPDGGMNEDGRLIDFANHLHVLKPCVPYGSCQ